MTNITWDMTEQFTFPVGLGAVEDIVTARVTPQWEQSDDGQSIRLSGIYHVAASVTFNPTKEVQQADGTYIEHLDIEQSIGYFEYALPLEVDLPAHKMTGPIALAVKDLTATHDDVSCHIAWQICCTFGDEQQEKAKVAHIEEPSQATEQLVVTEQRSEEIALQHDVTSPIAEHKAEEIVEVALQTTPPNEDFLAGLSEDYTVLRVRSNNIR